MIKLILFIAGIVIFLLPAIVVPPLFETRLPQPLWIMLAGVVLMGMATYQEEP